MIAPLQERGGRFWTWWSGELLMLYETRVLPRLPGTHLRGKIILGRRTGTVEIQDRGRLLSSDEIIEPLSEVGLLRLESILGNLSGRLKHMELQLAEDCVLIRPLRLLLPLRRHLRSAMALQIDQLTPFYLHEVAFDCLPVGTESSHGRFPAELAIVPRNLIDPVMTVAEQYAKYIHVSHQSAPATASGNRFVFEKRRANQKAEAAPRSTKLLQGLALGLLVVLLVTRALQIHSAQQDLEQALTELAPKVRSAELLRERNKKTVAQARFIQSQQDGQSAARVLALLSGALPINSWIYQLQWSPDQLQMLGEGANITAVTAAISGLPEVTSVNLRSSTSAGNGRERFDYILKLKKAPSP